MPEPDETPAPADAPDPADRSPRVHERATLILSAAGAAVPDARGGAILALVEASDPDDPPRVERAGAGCGGGRRVVVTGDAVFQSDGMSPTHLIVRAVGPDGAGVLILVERGDRGVESWPARGAATGDIAFRSVRLDAGRVLSGRTG